MFVPEFEDQEGPQELAVISIAGHVLVHQLLYVSRLEVSFPFQTALREHIFDQGTEGAGEPLGDGHVEPLFASGQNRFRQLILQGAAKDVLGCHAVQLQAVGDLRGVFYERVIEKWDAHFE
tara:strand:+ start:139 stop:501 length:363 start_codon:yes stop_codon:yes gene_type:complete